MKRPIRKPNSKPAKKPIHPPKPAPMGSSEGYARPLNWPMPKRWTPK